MQEEIDKRVKRIRKLSIINIVRDMKKHFTEQDYREEKECYEEISKLEKELHDLGYVEKNYL